MIPIVGQFLPIYLPEKELDEGDNEIDPDVEFQETMDMLRELQPQRPQHTKKKKRKK